MGALFLEVLVSQSLSSLVNFSFMVKVKETVIDDKLRAGWTGNVSPSLVLLLDGYFVI